MNSREYIVLHHTADRSDVPQFEKVNLVHKAAGFPRSSLGYFVGYHYFIGKDGTVKAARCEWETGAHCNAQMMNYRGIGIALAGNFLLQPVTAAQLKALGTLVRDICERNKIPATRILNHRDCKATECPGTNLKAMAIDQMQQSDTKDLQFKLEQYQELYKKVTNPVRRKRIALAISTLSRLLGV